MHGHNRNHNSASKADYNMASFGIYDIQWHMHTSSYVHCTSPSRPVSDSEAFSISFPRLCNLRKEIMKIMKDWRWAPSGSSKMGFGRLPQLRLLLWGELAVALDCLWLHSFLFEKVSQSWMWMLQFKENASVFSGQFQASFTFFHGVTGKLALSFAFAAIKLEALGHTFHVQPSGDCATSHPAIYSSSKFIKADLLLAFLARRLVAFGLFHFHLFHHGNSWERLTGGLKTGSPGGLTQKWRARVETCWNWSTGHLLWIAFQDLGTPRTLPLRSLTWLLVSLLASKTSGWLDGLVYRGIYIYTVYIYWFGEFPGLPTSLHRLALGHQLLTWQVASCTGELEANQSLLDITNWARPTCKVVMASVWEELLLDDSISESRLHICTWHRLGKAWQVSWCQETNCLIWTAKPVERETSEWNFFTVMSAIYGVQLLAWNNFDKVLTKCQQRDQ